MNKSGLGNKNTNKYLTVILDDGDEVISCIETAFKENDIRKAIIISADGKLKDIKIAVSRAGTLRQRIYSEALKVKNVSGEFNKFNNEYVGDLNISIERDPIHIVSGVLLRGVASGEVNFKFKIIKNVDYQINTQPPKSMLKEKIINETVKKEPKPFIIA